MSVEIDDDVRRSWEKSKAEEEEYRRREAFLVLMARKRYEIVKRQFDEKFEEMFGNEQSTRPKSD